MNRRHWQVSLLGFALLTVAAAPAFAQDNSKQPPRAGDGAQPQVKSVQPAVVADAPNARLAALIRHDLTIVRNKNVSAVARIGTGIYCITPTAAAGITPTTAIVQLTPEYYFSSLNEIKVQWASAGSGCGSSRLAVYTLADWQGNGVYHFSNAVSFSILVP